MSVFERKRKFDWQITAAESVIELHITHREPISYLSKVPAIHSRWLVGGLKLYVMTNLSNRFNPNQMSWHRSGKLTKLSVKWTYVAIVEDRQPRIICKLRYIGCLINYRMKATCVFMQSSARAVYRPIPYSSSKHTTQGEISLRFGCDFPGKNVVIFRLG